MDDLDVLFLIVSADVVGLEETAFLLYHIDSLGVILYIKPVADVLAVAVYRQFLAVQGIVDDKRDQLLRKLIGAVVVAAVGDIGREMVGIHISLHQHVRRSLTCGVGAVGRIGSGLVEIAAVLGEGTVHLIGGNVKEFLTLLEGAIRQLPGILCSVQHVQCSENICLNKNIRILDAAVHMALSCEMNNAVYIVLLEDLDHLLSVTDISFDKGIILFIFDILQILQIARVGQAVHVDDADSVAVFLEHIMNIVRPDKAGATGNQISFHFFPPVFSAFVQTFGLLYQISIWTASPHGLFFRFYSFFHLWFTVFSKYGKLGISMSRRKSK